MIQKLEISGIHYEISDDLLKYITKKIGSLDKYAERHARTSLHAEVKLKESKTKDKKQCQCEVIMHLPHGNITVSESTINMFAAVDIVESKLKNQLSESKKKHRKTHAVGIKGVFKKIKNINTDKDPEEDQ